MDMGTPDNTRVPLASVTAGDAPFSEQAIPGIPTFLESCRIRWMSDHPGRKQEKKTTKTVTVVLRRGISNFDNIGPPSPHHPPSTYTSIPVPGRHPALVMRPKRPQWFFPPHSLIIF